jgi:hypothetical protein
MFRAELGGRPESRPVCRLRTPLCCCFLLLPWLGPLPYLHLTLFRNPSPVPLERNPNPTTAPRQRWSSTSARHGSSRWTRVAHLRECPRRRDRDGAASEGRQDQRVARLCRADAGGSAVYLALRGREWTSANRASPATRWTILRECCSCRRRRERWRAIGSNARVCRGW